MGSLKLQTYANELDETTPLTEARHHADVYNDDITEMTRGRRLARYLSQFEWYNPHRHNHSDNDNNVDEPPSLDKAWSIFEHTTLPRHFKPQASIRHFRQQGPLDVNRKAEAGEHELPTQLYSVWHTPESDLGDFGVGVGVYFYTLRVLAVIMLVAGCLNSPNLLFFSSAEYNPSNDGIFLLSLKASAICTDATWAPCPTCTKEDWDRFPSTYNRYAEATAADGSTVLAFTKTNTNCEISERVGLVAYMSLVFVSLAIYGLQKQMTKQEIKIENAELTTTDYAVTVTNPPHDARNVDEWKAFFEQFGQVTSITVALNNEELVRALMTRRTLVNQLANLQPANVSVEHHKWTAAVETALPLTWIQTLMGTSNAKTIAGKIVAMDDKITKDLSQRQYSVSNVYCIFETEQAQQSTLEQMAVGGIPVLTQDVSSIPENLRFRGSYILSVKRPTEPSNIRWQELDDSMYKRLTLRFCTFILSVLVIGVTCLMVVWVRNELGIYYAALAISGISSALPTLFLVITELESHPTEESKQASNYIKLSIAMWILTAILTAFVTPFTDTLNNDSYSLIPAVYGIFISELIVTPVTMMVDLPGHFYRHIMAPRAPDQRRMDAYFTGAPYYLSERYTNMTSVLFFTFYYAMLYPTGFFWASGTLTVHYWVDKFCLLRNWEPAPIMGTKIARMSRMYFFTAVVVVYALMSSYNFASFPYDNACPLNETVDDKYIGSFTGTTGEGDPVHFTINKEDSSYKFCNQDMLRYRPFPAFPAVPASQPEGGEWMDPTAAHYSFLFGWTSVGVMFFVLGMQANAARKFIGRFLFGGFVSNSKPCLQGFSGLNDIYGYIPQVKIVGALHPTLVCDVGDISHDLIDWEDATDRSKRRHNAIYDVPGLVKDNPNDGVFSVVHEWFERERESRAPR